MASVPLLPSIDDVNAGTTSSVVDTTTTLNSDTIGQSDSTDSGGGTSVADVLSQLIATAPSIYLLAKTPQNRLPIISGGTPVQPKIMPASGFNTLTSSNIMFMFIILIIAIILIAVFMKG